MSRTRSPRPTRKQTGIKVVYEVTSVGSLPTRISTIAETGSGADITMNGLLQVIQFSNKYLDVGDIADEVGKAQGGWYDAGKEAVVVEGKWKAIPFANIGQLMNWRTDWFAEVGVKKFPETWEELYEVGKKLKAKDHPFGFELGHGFGDNHGWLYPLLWSYGGSEVAADGKTVVIDSDETARAVDFCRKFFKDTMLDDVPRLDRRQQQQGMDGGADLLHQQCRKHPVVRQARVSRNRQGHRPGDEPGGAEGALPSAQLDQPFDLRFLAGPGGGARLHALADGAEAAGRLVRGRGFLLPAAAARLRQCADVERRAAQPALSAMRSQTRICRVGPLRRAGNWPKSSPNTSSSTCSPRPAPARRPRTSSRTPQAQLKDIYRSA